MEIPIYLETKKLPKLKVIFFRINVMSCINDVIIKHASTNNVSNTTQQELCNEKVETLDEIQKDNPRSNRDL